MTEEYIPGERTARIIAIIRNHIGPISTPDIAKALSKREGGTIVKAPIIRMYCKRLEDKTGNSIIGSIEIERIPGKGGCRMRAYYDAQPTLKFE